MSIWVDDARSVEERSSETFSDGRLKNKGKHIKLILIAIMRKLAVIAFTLLQNGQDFQVERYK